MVQGWPKKAIIIIMIIIIIIWIYLRRVRETLLLEVVLAAKTGGCVYLGGRTICQNDGRQYLPETEMGTPVIFNCALADTASFMHCKI